MQRKLSKPKTADQQLPESYVVRFTCTLKLEGDVFVTAAKADAASVAKKQLALLDIKQLSDLSLRQAKKIRTGRIMSEQTVRKTLGPVWRDPHTPLDDATETPTL